MYNDPRSHGLWEKTAPQPPALEKLGFGSLGRGSFALRQLLPAQDRTYPRQEQALGERLRDIIVRAHRKAERGQRKRRALDEIVCHDFPAGK